MTQISFKTAAAPSSLGVFARGRYALLLLVAMALACLMPMRAQAQAGTGPDFLGTPTLVSGTDLQQGAVYRYTNVLPGIDALVTLAQFTNVTTLDQLDNPAPFPERFQPVIRCSTNSNVTCWVRFDFQFVQSGTNTPAPLPQVVASGQDVDGGRGTGTQGTREFVEFGTGATSVTVATPTFMTAAPALAGGTRFIQSSSANAQAGIGTDDRYEIYARYPAGISAFTIIGGNTIGGNACNPGAANDCNRLNSYTFRPNDANLASIVVRKTTVGGVGTFSFTGNNGFSSQSITTTVAGTPTAALPQPLTPGATTITEAAPPAGFTLTGIVCTGLGTGGTATPTINGTSGGNVVLNAAAVVNGSNIVCTFTNARLPILRLQKSLPNGRFVAADQFALTIAGTGGPANVTTTGTGTAATGVATINPGAIGAAYTFSEAGAAGANLANYATTYNCTNTLTGGQTPSGSGTSFNLTAVAGDNLTCTFVNTRNALANLGLTKTNTPGVNGNVDQAADTVTSGATTVYTITVSNAGPDAANNAVITDPAPTGASCSTATCTATGGAACPAQTGAALVTALQGAGATVPTLPVGGSVTITLNCTVP
jgi:trimeric autotransporter adhesin